MTFVKTLPAALLLAAALLAGCTHTREVGNGDLADYSFAQVNEALEGRRVDILLQDERTMASTALLIRPDTTWFIDLLNGRLRGNATQDISSLTRTLPGQGALEGAALGAGGGALVGLGVGFFLTTYRDKDEAQTSLAQYVSVPTVFFTILGIGTGALLGIRKGSRVRYVYPQMPYEASADDALRAPTAAGQPKQGNR